MKRSRREVGRGKAAKRRRERAYRAAKRARELGTPSEPALGYDLLADKRGRPIDDDGPDHRGDDLCRIDWNEGDNSTDDNPNGKGLPDGI